MMMKKEVVKQNYGRTPEDQAIIELLRDVVRKCTNPDSSKRPSASELYESLSFHLHSFDTDPKNIGETII